MPKFPKPFFVTARGVWRVQIDGRQINLGPDDRVASIEAVAKAEESDRPAGARV